MASRKSANAVSCPHCNDRDHLCLIETYEEVRSTFEGPIGRDQYGDLIPPPDGWVGGEPGDIISVRIQCGRCRHSWQPRRPTGHAAAITSSALPHPYASETTHGDLVAYLERTGWTQDSPGVYGSLWRIGQAEPVGITHSLDSNSPDWSDTVGRIARALGRPIPDIHHDLRMLRHDEFAATGVDERNSLQTRATLPNDGR